MRGVFYFKKYYVITFDFIINENYNSPILLIIIIMLKLLTSRLIQLLLVVWSVGTLTFVLMRSLPGDMAYRIASSRYGYAKSPQALPTKCEPNWDLTCSGMSSI